MFALFIAQDLEIAADFNLTTNTNDLFARLLETGHVQVLAPHSPEYMIFVPGRIASEPTYVIQLLNVSCGHDDEAPTNGSSETQHG